MSQPLNSEVLKLKQELENVKKENSELKARLEESKQGSTQEVNLNLCKAFDRISEGIAVCDFESSLIYTNLAFRQINSSDALDVEGKKITAIYPSIKPDKLKQIFKIVKRTGRWNGEISHVWEDDTQVQIRISMYLCQGNQGTPECILIISEDITDFMKKHEQEVLKNQDLIDEKERLSAIIENTSDLIAVATGGLEMVYINKAGRKFFSLHNDHEDISIKNAHPQWAFDMIKNIAIPEAIEKGIWRGETSIISKDKKEVDVSQVIMSHLSPRGKLEYLSTIMRDISEQKRIEKELKHSEQKFSTAFRSVPESISISKAHNGEFIEINDAFCDYSGYSREEILGKSSFELQIWNKLEQRNEVLGLLRNGVAIKNKEYQFRKKSGELFTGLFFADMILIDNRPHILAVTSDITERKNFEIKLKKAQNYVKNIFNSMPSMLIGISSDEKITHWNMEAEKVTGKTANLIKGKLIYEVMPEIEYLKGQIDNSLKQKIPNRLTKVKLAFQQTETINDFTVYPLISNGLDGAVIRIDDISEKVVMEEMVVQSEKMLSVGGLAAGMAHEINNPLAGILQNIQVLKQRLSSNLNKNHLVAQECGTDIQTIIQYMQKRDIFEIIDMIINSGYRAARIVENMLSFSRKSESKFSSYDLCSLMDKTLELAGNDYDLKQKYDFRKIIITKNYESDLPEVPCESTKIQQVFLNVLKNGAQAMSSNEDPGIEPCFEISISRQEDNIRVEICDNGPGMDAKISKRIFEPFFTTKDVGKGTGLGLSVSYFIITENHKGKMSVESILGKGSKFIIELPIKREPRVLVNKK